MLTPIHVPAVRYEVPNALYHAGPGLSHSGAQRLRRTPHHYAALLAPTAPARAPSPQMVNGTLVHCALLEPEQWPTRYAVPPEHAADKRSRAGREFAEHAAKQGLAVITQQQADAAQAQAAALRALPEVAQLLDDGNPEVSAYWRDHKSGVLCKCRPDWVSPVGYGRGVVLLDCKTTADARADAFARSVVSFGYHTQADWYCDGYAHASGMEVHGMVFAVVESEFPYAATPYMLDDEALRKGRELNAAARRLYAQCNESDTWPGYPQTIQVLSLPPWA